MAYLKKEEIFFERDGNGNLLPVEVILETLDTKPTIKAIPLNKGELAEIANKSTGNNTDIDVDINVIISNCVNPEFSEDDRAMLLSAGKAKFTNAIALAIFSISTDISQQDLLNQGNTRILKKELENFRQQ